MALLPTRLFAQEGASPLTVVMAGREAASGSRLNEAGVRELAVSAANITMYIASAAGIGVVCYGLFYLWALSSEGEGTRRTVLRGVMILLVGGLLTIPAIVTAIAPHALLGAVPEASEGE